MKKIHKFLYSKTLTKNILLGEGVTLTKLSHPIYYNHSQQLHAYNIRYYAVVILTKDETQKRYHEV